MNFYHHVSSLRLSPIIPGSVSRLLERSHIYIVLQGKPPVKSFSGPGKERRNEAPHKCCVIPHPSVPKGTHDDHNPEAPEKGA